MSLHSKFLIHWTGKDFCDNEDKRLVQDKYVERLRDTCQHGLYMQKGREEICGVGGKCVKPDIARVCFSEIRLSQVRRHARRYGGLGIGVHRSFIVEREGNPVFYIQSGSRGHVGENFAVIHINTPLLIRALEMLREDKIMAEALDKAFQRAMEEYAKQIQDRTTRGSLEQEARRLQMSPEEVRRRVLNPLLHIMGYLKNMSDKDAPRLRYYDEMEWRVVHTDRLENQGLIACLDREHHVYGLKVSAREIRIIVFPDDATRMLALRDESLQHYFGNDWPIVTTLDECAEF